MSRSERQAITKLAIISGSLKTIFDFSLSEKENPILLYAIDVCDEIIKKYPCKSWNRKALKEVESVLAEYDNELKLLPVQRYSAILLTTMCSQIITDMLELIKDKAKLQLIEPLEEAVDSLHNTLDPAGIFFDDYERADSLVQRFYSIADN